MFSIFFWIAFAFAILDWLAVGKQWKKLEYVAKPGTMVALLFWLLIEIGLTEHLSIFWAGLFFSMIGDVMLMLPKERFVAGLVAFLLGHVCYVIGFNSGWPPINIIVLAMLVLIGTLAYWVYRRLAQGLVAKGFSALQKPVLAYAVVISLMLLSALITLLRSDWVTENAIIVSIGAGLFFLSDSMLAWNRFVTPISYGRLKVIIPYHLGQILIALGAAIQFMR